MASGRPSCTTLSSVPTDTFFNVTVTWMSPGRLGSVRVAQAFVRNELDIFASERMAFARREIPEGHFERPADFWFQMMYGTGKAIGRQPFRERVPFEERAIDFLRPSCQNAVQTNGVGHGRPSLC